MYIHYFYWQYFKAPVWLATLLFNIQRAIWQYFSVDFMIKTLFSYWHKDRVSYKQGSISGFFQAIAWNLISRGIGFVIRVIMLSVWLILAVSVLVFSIALWALFILWPILSLVGLATGIVLLLQ